MLTGGSLAAASIVATTTLRRSCPTFMSSINANRFQAQSTRVKSHSPYRPVPAQRHRFAPGNRERRIAAARPSPPPRPVIPQIFAGESGHRSRCLQEIPTSAATRPMRSANWVGNLSAGGLVLSQVACEIDSVPDDFGRNNSAIRAGRSRWSDDVGSDDQAEHWRRNLITMASVLRTPGPRPAGNRSLDQGRRDERRFVAGSGATATPSRRLVERRLARA